MLTVEAVTPYLEKIRAGETTQAQAALDLRVTYHVFRTFLARNGLSGAAAYGSGGPGSYARPAVEMTPDMREAVEEALKGSVLAVAKKRGIRYATLHKWVTKEAERRKAEAQEEATA